MMAMNYFIMAGIVQGMNDDIFADRAVQIICAHYNVKKSEMLSRDRHRYLVDPRHLIHHFLRKHTKLSLHRIGFMTMRDHATVMHSMKTVKNWMESDPDFRDRVHIIQKDVLKIRQKLRDIKKGVTVSEFSHATDKQKTKILKEL